MINVYHLTDAVPAALFGMFALWAAGSRRHWFVRMAVVGAALLIMLLIPAYDLVLKFGAEVLFLVLGLAAWRRWRRRRPQPTSPHDGSPPLTQFRPQVSLATLMLLMVVVAVVTTVASRAPDLAIYEWAECFGIGIMTAATGLACVWIVCGQTRWWFRLLAVPLLVFGLAVATRWMWNGRWLLQHWITSPTYAPKYWQGIMQEGVFGGAEYWLATVSIGMAILCSWLFLMDRAGWFDPFHEAVGQSIRHRVPVRGRMAARWAAAALFVLASLFPLLLLYKLLTPAPIPDLSAPRPNGYDDLLAAGRRMGKSDVRGVWQLRQLSDAQLRKSVEKNAAAFAMLDAALSRECRFPLMGGLGHKDLLPDDELSALFGLLDGILARCLLATKNGSIDEKLKVNMDLIRLATLEARSNGVDRYAEYRVFSPYWGAGDQLWLARTAMTADQCIEIANELWELDRQRVPWEQRVENERIIAENSGWERHLRSILDEWAGVDRFENERYLDSVDQIEHRMLAVELAIRAFGLKAGRLPATLEELTPDYLPSLPADPYDDGRPLKYRVSGGKYVLYSIGPNQTDDGGIAPVNGAGQSGGDLTDGLLFPAPVTQPAGTQSKADDEPDEAQAESSDAETKP